MSYNFVRSVYHLIKPTILWPRIATLQSTLLQCSQCRQQAKLFSAIHNNISRTLLTFPSNGITSKRSYAKGKDKKKEKGKTKLDESILTGVVDLEKMHNQYGNYIEGLKEEYTRNLSLRSTSGAIETLDINFDGSSYKLQELAQIIRQNPKSVILNLSSFPQAIPAVLQAIEKSGMNLNPQQDGTKLFIPVPKVTKEFRESLAKNAKAMFVKCKTNLKDVQNKLIKSIKNKEKSEGLSTDLIRTATEQVTVVCDTYIAQAEKIFNSKQAELKGE